MAKESMPVQEWIRKGFEEHGSDLLREMVAVFSQVLMSADVDAACGAAYGSRSPERVTRRNGYRTRSWDTRVQIEQRFAKTQVALDHLTAAVAEGGDVPTLVEAIKARDKERARLEQQLEGLDSPAVTFDAALEQKLRDTVDQWREVLGRQVPHARQIVQKLIAEKLVFTPVDRDGRRGFRFQATGTVEKLVSRVSPAFSQAVVSPRGLVDLYQLEIRGETRRVA